ncbi:hypothetical protein [Nocardia salmonicida]|uniref:hypothetical protein n=1 Tax=Nocardia salmonicida TaxID=53431 RepID=UPI0037A1B62E
MTTTETTTGDQAARIAAEVTAAFPPRAVDAWPGDWVSGEAFRRYVALLLTGTAHAPAPRTVVAEVTGPDIPSWGYAAFEVLDAVSARHQLPDTAHISDEAPGRYRLTW